MERRVEEKGSPRRGGRAPAEMLVRVLYQLFRHAEKTGRLEEGRNPAGLLEVRDFGIDPARSRDRALSPEEMATLLLHPDIDLPGLLEGKAPPQDGLARLSLSTRAAIILGPHLAVRPIAMLGMRWDEVDLKKGLWTVQGGRGAKLRHHLKAKAKPFAVPLSGTPAAVLGALRKAAGSSPFVLPSESKAGHLTGDVYADALHRLTQRLELAGGPVRPHDARRTFAATATRLGVERYVVDKALQHSLGKIGDTYLVDDSLDRRRAAHVLVDEHWTAVRVGRAAKVVGIRPVP